MLRRGRELEAEPYKDEYGLNLPERPISLVECIETEMDRVLNHSIFIDMKMALFRELSYHEDRACDTKGALVGGGLRSRRGWWAGMDAGLRFSAQVRAGWEHRYTASDLTATAIDKQY